jgi:hypothetical protein
MASLAPITQRNANGTWVSYSYDDAVGSTDRLTDASQNTLVSCLWRGALRGARDSPCPRDYMHFGAREDGTSSSGFTSAVCE